MAFTHDFFFCSNQYIGPTHLSFCLSVKEITWCYGPKSRAWYQSSSVCWCQAISLTPLQELSIDINQKLRWFIPIIIYKDMLFVNSNTENCSTLKSEFNDFHGWIWYIFGFLNDCWLLTWPDKHFVCTVKDPENMW